jgi:hypothetical protein
MTDQEHSEFRFAISLSVLNHLGRNLYRNFITVLGEAISNSWDADAKNIWIDFDKDESFLTIKDDGVGMDADDFQNRFLKIGYSKRKDGVDQTDRGRPFIGAKGIGKLALLSCASRVTIFSKREDSDYIGGVIDNSGLDTAITDNLNPEEYPLETPNVSIIDHLVNGHDHGTILVFEEAKELLRVSGEQIRKLLALSFYVNGTPISVNDLESLARDTEFVWKIAEYNDDFLEICSNVKRWSNAPETKLQISGYLATVEKPSNLNVRGASSRATVDLFVHGRLREKNVLRHIPTQRIVESYLYGQIHFDTMAGDGDSPFTSSREGIVETDPNFQALVDYLKKELIPKIIDQWDEFRLARGEDGDEENPRKTKRQRKAAGLVQAIEQEFKIDENKDQKTEEQDLVEKWLSILRPDAEFNVDAYVDCFLSENLIRKYMNEYKILVTPVAQKDIEKWKGREADTLAEANIHFDVRKDRDDLSYLDMDKLAICAEGSKSTSGKITPLYQNAISFKPVRNAVGHTGVLTDNAKTHLTLTLENLKGRLRKILSAGAPE